MEKLKAYLEKVSPSFFKTAKGCSMEEIEDLTVLYTEESDWNGKPPILKNRKFPDFFRQYLLLMGHENNHLGPR